MTRSERKPTPWGGFERQHADVNHQSVVTERRELLSCGLLVESALLADVMDVRTSVAQNSKDPARVVGQLHISPSVCRR